MLFERGYREAGWFVVQKLPIYPPPFLRVAWKLLELGFELVRVVVESSVESGVSVFSCVVVAWCSLGFVLPLKSFFAVVG